MKTELKAAIARSVSHNERVAIEVEAADITDVLAELGTITDVEIDSAQENDGSYDVWGAGEGDDMAWRLCVTLAAA